MRRLALFLAGFGFARLFSRRPPQARQLPPPAAGPEPDPRADALRAKLAQARELVEEREEFEGAETPVDEADPDERRRRVHEAARAAVEEMHASSCSDEA